MAEANTTASWIGKAAYQIMQRDGLNGRDANAEARAIAEGLLNVGINLDRIDPRDYGRSHFDHPAALCASRQRHTSTSVIERQNRQSAFLSGVVR